MGSFSVSLRFYLMTFLLLVLVEVSESAKLIDSKSFLIFKPQDASSNREMGKGWLFWD